jgi:exonuclease SbcD
MGKLRHVYPNVLHLERTGMTQKTENTLKKEALKRGEYSMFQDFFSQITGEKMTKEQDQTITKLINTLKQ